MERLNELSLVIRGQIMGKDMDHAPVSSLATTHHTAASLDMPQASFDEPQAKPSTS